MPGYWGEEIITYVSCWDPIRLLYVVRAHFPVSRKIRVGTPDAPGFSKSSKWDISDNAYENFDSSSTMAENDYRSRRPSSGH
jgi:hypothetical protein